MRRVAIVTDSASDLDTSAAAEAGIAVVPLIAIFGDEQYQASVDVAPRILGPADRARRAVPADRGRQRRHLRPRRAMLRRWRGGSRLRHSGRDAQRDSEQRPDGARRSTGPGDPRGQFLGPSMVVGMLAQLGAEMADHGVSASEIAAEMERQIPDLRLFVMLDTLEYLVRGGRIGRGRALMGAMLSLKPILTVLDGVVDTADRPRTRSKARQRLVELITARPVERITLLYTPGESDVEAFGDILARAAGDRPGDPGRADHRGVDRTARRAGRVRRGRALAATSDVQLSQRRAWPESWPRGIGPSGSSSLDTRRIESPPRRPCDHAPAP